MPINHQPSVSVVVPLFNKRLYIAECLKSICLQTFQNFEVLVVNDGSTDGSGDLAREASDPRIRVITQTNQGEGAARNRGITEAKGHLIAFLDADDSWETGFLDAILELSHRYPEAGILATGFRRCYRSGPDKHTTIEHNDRDRQTLIYDYFRKSLDGEFVHSSSVAIPAWVFKQIGYFAEGEPMGCDKDLWGRIALKYPVAHDNQILGRYYLGATGRVCDEWAGRPRHPLILRTLRSALTKEVPQTLLADVHAYMDHVLMKYAYALLYNRRKVELIELLRTEKLCTSRVRSEARLLRMCLGVLPCRVIFALKHKPERLVQVIARNRPVSRMRVPTSRVVTRFANSRGLPSGS